MTLEELNHATKEDAERALLQCCGSRKWAAEMSARRPYASFDDVLRAADAADAKLSHNDWLDAFAAHPRIGERSASAWSQKEQAAALTAEEGVKQQLQLVNQQYEDKYGFIFIVFASGKTPQQILELAQRRMQNDRQTEIENAAAEQRQITRARLHKLLEL